MNKNKVIENFSKYVHQYDMKDLRIYGKYDHTFHVAQNCEQIAFKIGLSDTECDIAWLTGMLHDIGRFEQVTKAKSFRDKNSFPHAEYGCKLLFEDDMIKQFCDNEDWYDYIHKAILYHSRLNLSDGLTAKEKMFCDILRDADKIDIFRRETISKFELFHECTLEEVQESEISDDILQMFLNHQMMDFSKIKTKADYFLRMYGFYFGLVFPYSYLLTEQQGFFNHQLNFKFTKESNRKKFEIIKTEIQDYKESMFSRLI